MTDEELERIRGLPLESVAERNGLNVIRHKSLCPFHDDHHASLSFKGNKYRCYACGAYGDGISLTMHMQRLRFADACRWLANEGPSSPPNVPRPERKGLGEGPSLARYLRYFEHPYLNVEARKFLYEERRLSPSIVEWCRLSSWTDRDGISWLQIPYYSPQGELIGMQARRLTPSDTLPRFRFPRGCRPLIYNQRILPSIRTDEELWIAEGITDCLALLSSGRKSIAIPSATLLTRPNREILGTAPTRNWHMAPDQDPAGEMLYRTLLSAANECGASLTRHQLPQGCKDFSDYWKSH